MAGSLFSKNRRSIRPTSRDPLPARQGGGYGSGQPHKPFSWTSKVNGVLKGMDADLDMNRNWRTPTGTRPFGDMSILLPLRAGRPLFLRSAETWMRAVLRRGPVVQISLLMPLPPGNAIVSDQAVSIRAAMEKNARIARLILALTDDELEAFVREWVGYKKEYTEVQRFTGPGDMGRDVVGYLTPKRHEGPWHNYQCKQYGRTLQTSTGLSELAKILYYSHRGEFTIPIAYFFVAPRGVNRNLRRYISKPSELRDVLISQWDAHCAHSIAEGQTISLTPELSAHIAAWAPSSVGTISLDDILLDSAAKAALQSWFGVDPGPAPLGVVPDQIGNSEMPYVQQLLDAYGERDACTIAKDEALQHPLHGEHLKMQRERFFDADAFARFYRDNTMQDDIDVLRRDIRHGIAETHAADYADSLRRHDAVMTQAAQIYPSGALARHARVPVKQGICHHFANEGALKWRKT
jgi:hypothetical protein